MRILFTVFLLGMLVLPLTGCVSENELGSVLQEIKQDFTVGKDPMALLAKHGIPRNGSASSLTYKLPEYKNLHPQQWEYIASIDEGIYQRIRALYADIKDVNLEKEFSTKGYYNRNAVRGLIEFKQKAPGVLLAREKAQELLATQKAREREEQEQKLAKINIAKKNAPLIVSDLYKKTVKPVSFEQIMNAVSFLPDWKIDAVFYSADRTVDYSETFNFAGIGDPLPKIQNNTYRIFNNPPLAVDQKKEIPIMIVGSITKKIGSQYVLSRVIPDPKFEAIADIPKSIISGSGIGFTDACFIVCKLTNIEEVNTFLGTKTVAIVKVLSLFPFGESDQFVEYILGHPEQFPPKKYVNLTVK